MAEPSVTKAQLMDEIVNRQKMGDKRFHSETSLQNFGEDAIASTPIEEIERDPGVQNASLNDTRNEEASRRRTHSQPGPVSGSLLTASAARAARKKNVNYAANDMPKIILPGGGDGSGTVTPTGDRSSPFPNNPIMYNGNFLRNDLRSINGYKMYSSAPATPRKRSMATTGGQSLDAQSLRSIETHAPPPTDPKENRKLTKKYLGLIISSIYALMLVTLGLIIHIGDALVEPPISVIYSFILAGLGFVYHLYLIYDIQKYKKVALSNQKIKTQYEEKMADYFRKQEEEYGMRDDNIQRPQDWYKETGVPPPVLAPLSHNYCFNQGRHSGSFYLKIGAAGFALGNLVHCTLLIVVQLGYLTDENIDNDRCVEYIQVAYDIFYPIYCFLQLFFVFKFSNVIILKAQGLALFAFMHMIGSSLCFWISAIVRETILGLTIYAQYIYGGDNYEYGNNLVRRETLANTTHSGKVSDRFFDVIVLYDEECMGSDAFTTIFQNFSPYLYPFSVEFNILIVAVYYIIWSHIGHCHNEDIYGSDLNNSLEDAYSVCKIPTANEENDYTSNFVIYADCHASNKGLFSGLLVMVIIIGMLIIGFVFSTVGGEYLEIGYLVNNVTKLGLHSVMLFAAILAFTQTTRLDINEHPISLLDDILLFVCLPPFFMETVFSLLATLTILNITTSIDFIVMVIQVLVQTPLIIDALRRCSNSKKLRRKKPARELIMFLLITNVGMWLFYTFSYKSPDSLDERYEYYGKVVWTILGHVSLPLIMFYRFHSSVCFADIWDSAYKPGLEH